MLVAYIAGPMRGYDLFNYPLFMRVERKLKKMGYTVHNPARISLENGFEPNDWKDFTKLPRKLAEYMAVDLPLVCKSDVIVVLPGWLSSQGATIEVGLAISLGKIVRSWPDMRVINPYGRYP